MTKENFTELISKVPSIEMYFPETTTIIMCVECNSFDIELSVTVRVECKSAKCDGGFSDGEWSDIVIYGPKYEVYLNGAHDENGDDLDGELFSDEQWEMLVDVVSNSVKFS